MPSEENKAIVRRFFEVFSEGNLEELDNLLAADFGDHDAPAGLPPGPDGVRALLIPYRAAFFPDLDFTISDQVAEGDRVATRWTMRGTYRGELFKIPPSGKEVSMEGISLYRIAEAKMKEAWVKRNDLGLMQHLGVISEPGQIMGA
jgi:steroid delta-isomerase-like uncharacterized protein